MITADLKPGLHRVSRADYDRMTDRVNWSRAKLMAKSPAHYRDSLLNPTPDTDPRKRGRATHVATFEPERYQRQYVVWDGRRAGKDWEKFREQWESKGAEILTEGMDEAARAIAKAVRSHELAARYLRSGVGEQTLIWTHVVPDVGGLKGYRLDCKGRPDFITSDNVFVDLKTTKDASLDGFARQAIAYGYHGQAAMYLDGYEAATGARATYVIVAIEPVTPFAVTVFRLPEEIIRLGREHYRGLLDRIHHCTETNDWPSYANEEVELSLPQWDGNEVTPSDPTGLGLDFGQGEEANGL